MEKNDGFEILNNGLQQSYHKSYIIRIYLILEAFPIIKHDQFATRFDKRWLYIPNRISNHDQGWKLWYFTIFTNQIFFRIRFE